MAKPDHVWGLSYRDLKTHFELNGYETLPPKDSAQNNSESVLKYRGNLVGDINPSLPDPPAGDDGCGFADIIVAAITIAVSTVAGPVLGNIAGQVAGNVLGTRDGFDLGEVAMAVVMQNLDLPIPKEIAGSEMLATAAKAAANNVAYQGVNMMVGRQDSFNWKGVVASAIAAPIANGLVNGAVGALPNGTSPLVRDFVAGATSSIVRQGVYSAVTGGRMSLDQIAVDAFSNAIGQSIAGKIIKGASQQYTELEGAQDTAREMNRGSWQATSPQTDEISLGSGLQLRAGDVDNFYRIPSLINPYELQKANYELVDEGQPIKLSRIEVGRDAPNSIDWNAFNEIVPQNKPYQEYEPTAGGNGGATPRYTGGYVNGHLNASNSMTASDYATKGKDYEAYSKQLSDLAQGYLAKGDKANAQLYQEGANKLYYEGQGASLRALSMNASSQRSILTSLSSSPFATGWNTGDYSAGVPSRNSPQADYVTLQANLYIASGGVSINMHNGEIFGQWALGRAYPGYSSKPGVSVVFGDIINGGDAKVTSDFLKGGSGTASAFYPLPIAPVIGVGGGLNYSYGGKVAVEYGVSLPAGSAVNPVGYGFEVKQLGK